MTLALGSCIFHSFASSFIVSRSRGKATGIGLFLGGSTIGFALTAFAPFLGHIGAIIMTVCAIPDDNSAEIDVTDETDNKKIPLGKVFAPILLLGAAYMLIFYEFSSFSFPWNSFFKTQLVTSVAIAVGRMAGGIVSDRIGRGVTVLGAIFSGTALIYFCSGSRALGTLGLVLISMTLAPIASAVLRLFPKHGGFVFALFSTFAYLGQELTFYAPMKKEWQILAVALVVALAVYVNELPTIISSLRRGKEQK